MLVGIPKEIKNNEYRTGLTPESVQEFTAHGHEVIVQTQLGAGINALDADYEAAGAVVVSTAEEIFERAELIIKVKEPQPNECEMLRRGQILFTYLHLAPDDLQTELLLKSGVTAIAYETVTDQHGTLPLLAPMSEVAGRLSVQAGAHCLEKSKGGLGVLLGGVTGVEPADVVIIGGGVVGNNAAFVAHGMGARVTILDNSIPRLRQLDIQYGGNVNCVFSNRAAIENYAKRADLLIGGVLVAGAEAPKLVTREMVREMKPGAVICDVAIDQGGCVETSHATTHSDPTYVVDEVVHYCVANMPGAVPRTSSYALNHATLPYALKLADKGWRQALRADRGFLPGLNVHEGKLTCEAVAEAQDLKFVAPETLL
ncbi:MAG: alanine dehydrogenase [Gammaproteobacteria bacterium]|nr:alanine dehydrogenase [Gammaproteobacteria bacterium]